MVTYEKSKEDLLCLLRSIDSLEDLKEKKESMIESQVIFVSSAVDTLNDFFENLSNYSQEEKKAQVERLSDEKFIFDDKINGEMGRIYNLPGCGEYIDSIDPEVQSKLEPPMNEYISILQTKMMDVMNEMMGFMGPAMGAMAEGLDAAAAEMQKNAKDMEETVERIEIYIPSNEVQELTYGLTSYLQINNIDHLKQEKDALFEYVNDLFNDIFGNMEISFEMKIDRGMLGSEIKRMVKTKMVTKEEVEKLFDRMEKSSGDKEYIGSLREEFKVLMAPVEDKVGDYKYRFTQL